MAHALSILCIHGVGHGDADTQLAPAWTAAIERDVHRWAPRRALRVDFLRYDALFDHAPLNPAVFAAAVARLLASGVAHGFGDVAAGAGSLADLPEAMRWTAGMIAQWASEDRLRAALRKRVLARMRAHQYDTVCAFSLGSLIAYDAFARAPAAIAGRDLVTFGSQIGNAFVRDCFAGRIVALGRARMWYDLYNPNDHVFAAPIRLSAANFLRIATPFDTPGDALNHDPIAYLDHENTQQGMWPTIAAPARAMLPGDASAVRRSVRRPDRRALLVAVNRYPDPLQRLEGCVNDAFLASALLQECGIAARDIRMVADAHATTAAILEALRWLLEDVPPGAERVLYYSGHGAQLPSYDPRGEVDHLDECLVPVDFDWSPAHAIRDKQLVELYSQLPYDARFVAVFDCCHSGGLGREGMGRVRGLDPPDDVRHRMLAWDPRAGTWRPRRLATPNASLARSIAGAAYLGENRATYRLGRGVALRGLPNRTYDRERSALGHRGPYLPIILEACGEQQSAYEYRHGAESYGAFTFALARALREARSRGSNPTFAGLSRLAAAGIRALRYEQDPCLVGPPGQIARRIPWASPRKPSRPRAKAIA